MHHEDSKSEKVDASRHASARLNGKASPPAALAKKDDILTACQGPPDLSSLIELATSSDGLVNDDLRRQACSSALFPCPSCAGESLHPGLPHFSGPILLGYPAPKGAASIKSQPWQLLPRHKDEDQVRLDVDRSFVYYPKSRSIQSLGLGN